MKNPYSDLPKVAFWSNGVSSVSPYELTNIYTKKWPINQDCKIATAGSCFAQHVARHLIKRDFNVLDMEPAPRGLSQKLCTKFGFSMYSCRYGNIYTVHQLLQLAREVSGTYEPQDIAWEKNGKYFDALRPAIEPDGLDSTGELYALRKYHLERVREMFKTMDLFIFTLGLTEAWVHKDHNTVYPTAPGTIAGSFDKKTYLFKNFQFQEIIRAFNDFQDILLQFRADGQLPKILLTVSPVPLTATASGKHVLSANAYSKSVLRAVAGQLSDENEHIDYFPSFEIITNQTAQAAFYASNYRSIKQEGVNTVMKTFFSEHGETTEKPITYKELTQSSMDIEEPEEDIQCEEALLEAFAK